MPGNPEIVAVVGLVVAVVMIALAAAVCLLLLVPRDHEDKE